MDRDDTQGFSLAELMVVVAIIGILMLIAVASFVVATSHASAAACASNRRALNFAVQISVGDTGDYPTDINDLQSYVHNWGSARKCPDGPLLYYDSATHGVICPVHGR